MEPGRQKAAVATGYRGGIHTLGAWVRSLCVGVALLLPPILANVLAPSVYVFGLGAVIAAATLGPGSVALIVMIIAAAVGTGLEAHVGVTGSALYLHVLVFMIVAGGVLFIAVRSSALRSRLDIALDRVERREALLNSILETGADAMLVIDDRGIVSRFSTSAEVLFGWTKAEVVGRNVKMLMPAPYHEEHDGYIDRFLKTGERRIIGKSRPVTGLRKDGSQFPMALYVGEIRFGEERHFTGFAHDLTALYEAHNRSEELRNQLTSVWRMNSLGEMAAMLAHELNQPLSAISNYMRGARNIALRLELKDDELLDALEIAGGQAVRAGEIIRRARAMVAREEVEHKPESLLGLITATELMMETMARESQVSLRLDLAPEPCLVSVDRIQIQQVLGNLVRNAVDAMKDSPEKILEISTRRRGDHWVVVVEDSGPGVTPDIARTLFDPLTTSKAGGMGLGLSISRKIVERHGGAIWFEKSRLGGVAFCFSLLNEPAS